MIALTLLTCGTSRGYKEVLPYTPWYKLGGSSTAQLASLRERGINLNFSFSLLHALSRVTRLTYDHRLGLNSRSSGRVGLASVACMLHRYTREFYAHRPPLHTLPCVCSYATYVCTRSPCVLAWRRRRDGARAAQQIRSITNLVRARHSTVLTRHIRSMHACM